MKRAIIAFVLFTLITGVRAQTYSEFERFSNVLFSTDELTHSAHMLLLLCGEGYSADPDGLTKCLENHMSEADLELYLAEAFESNGTWRDQLSLSEIKAISIESHREVAHLIALKKL